MAQPPDIAEFSLPCVRIFQLSDGREAARYGHFENAFPWISFEKGGFALGRDLRVEYVKIDDSIVDASMQLYRDGAAYKIFLTRQPVRAGFAVYENPFLHSLPEHDPVSPLIRGKFHVFIGDDVSFIVSSDLGRIGICPRATLDWNLARPVLFQFLTDPAVVHYLNCGNFLMGHRPRD